MLQFTCLPKAVSNWLQVLRPIFRHRHHLVFCWLLVCQVIYQEKATVKGLARLAPRHIAEWHLRRLLKAAYWPMRGSCCGGLPIKLSRPCLHRMMGCVIWWWIAR